MRSILRIESYRPHLLCEGEKKKQGASVDVNFALKIPHCMTFENVVLSVYVVALHPLHASGYCHSGHSLTKQENPYVLYL